MKHLIILLAMGICSCNWAKEKTKETANKTGEVVATAGSEFANGVAKGVEKHFPIKLFYRNNLSEKD